MTNAPLQDNDCRTFSVLAENRFGVLARVAVEPAGKTDRIDDFIALSRDFGIIDMARSGRAAIARCRN